MSQPYIGEIRMFGGNFAPRGWMFCNGQVLAIAQYNALFALLGTTYGGNGQTTFALPNLQGRVPMHWGQGAGLSYRALGETGGTETVTLLQQQIPAHVHSAPTTNGSSAGATSHSPAGAVLATQGPHDPPIYAQGAGDVPMSAAGNTGATGGSQSHANMQPYLAVSFIIAVEGIFPSRN